MQKLTKPIVIGTVGSGYGAYLHVNGYLHVSGVPVRLKALCDVNYENGKAFADRYGYETVYTDFQQLLDDPEIDVIDLGVPPRLHIPYSIRALKAGKSIICEKPITGYFGNGEDGIGNTVKKEDMWHEMEKNLEELKAVIAESKGRFMYAEDFIYATPVQKAAEILRAKKSKIMMMSGVETIIGSSSPLAGHWKNFGGGTIMRNGIHPLTVMLYLKQVEAKARGEEITIRSVTADCGQQTSCLTEAEHTHVKARPIDVEDFATITVTFSDGSKCAVLCSDATLGGSRNYVDVFASDTSLHCTITQNNLLSAYVTDETGLEGVNWGELVNSKMGWNNVFVSDEVIRGYTGEMEAFLKAVAYDTEPETSFDLAYSAIKVCYAAYRSAEEGRRIDF